MSTAKVSLSLSESDLAFLDTQTLEGGYPSRSAVVHAAVRLLRESRLADAYAEAYAEGYDDEWDSAADDGLATA
ncbi:MULTISPECIES: ribbon-helix-helix domain-containing protein [unclassified Microbacterium]|uniref:ribbon-helix-helix domain-containing protein n=1 Tax=unclassified Microbacterium TaxID=2609290 RepID=UPI000493AAA8|nr:MULTISPECIES: type II toxin-antitoxin system ParD family antitoxin [unclassified Microbacterium]